MTVDEFFQKYNGKLVDYDGFYGFQCMDLYQQYNKDVVEGPHLPANAYQVWDTYPHDLYTRIENTLEGVPQLGDVIIWNKNTGGGYGHIAVFKEGDIDSFLSFDQNWPVGSVCHFQNHNYTNVLGWLRPKNSAIITQSIAQLTLQTIIPKALLDGEDQDLEIQQIAGLLKDGKRDNLDLTNCRKVAALSISEVEDLHKKLEVCQTALDAQETPQTPPEGTLPTQTIEWPSILVKLWNFLKRL